MLWMSEWLIHQNILLSHRIFWAKHIGTVRGQRSSSWNRGLQACSLCPCSPSSWRSMLNSIPLDGISHFTLNVKWRGINLSGKCGINQRKLWRKRRGVGGDPFKGKIERKWNLYYFEVCLFVKFAIDAQMQIIWNLYKEQRVCEEFEMFWNHDEN